jgi:hypothetical protein
MVRYFYAWIPVFAIGTICILSLPWLGLIALAVVALALLVPLAWALVYLPYMLVRAIGRSLQGPVVTYHAPQLARSPSSIGIAGFEGANR